MADTTVDLLIESRGLTERRDLAMAADQVCYTGSAIFVNDTTGYAQDDKTGSTQLAGISTARHDSTGESAGAKSCEYFVRGDFKLTGSGFAQADVGALVYFSDNQTITKTSTSNVLAGRISGFVSSTEVWVSIQGAGILQ